MSYYREKEKEKEEIGIQVARSVLYRAHLTRNGSCYQGQKEAGVAIKYRTAYPHLRLDPSHECNTY
jgi:hypothetical protein